MPIVVLDRIYPASGSVLEGNPVPEPSNVLIYGEQSVIDSIHKVMTDLISMKDVSETKKVEVPLRKIKGSE